MPRGSNSISCPAASVPSRSVPVTTVPKPLIVKARSTGRRGRPCAARGGVSLSSTSSAAFSASSPCPVVAAVAISGAFGERRPLHGFARRLRRQFEEFLIDGVRFGEDDQPTVDAEQIEDGEMLARLRHRPFVRRHDEQRRVDPADARQHILDESLVPRHIDDAHRLPGGKRQPREAEVDGHLARLLLRQSVGVDPRQRADKRALAVIHMPRRPDDIGTFRHAHMPRL